MIYFDENREAYSQLDTLKKWGKTLIYQCPESIYQEFLENKRIWGDNNELILNPNYEKEQQKVQNEKQIQELQEELTSNDYKIIKCFEAQMTNEPLPYDLETLHAERQAKRDKINELQALINT